MAKAINTAQQPRKAAANNGNGANLGFEVKLWQAADKLRNNMDVSAYKHVVLGLVFFRYISDSFDEHYPKLVAGEGQYVGAMRCTRERQAPTICGGMQKSTEWRTGFARIWKQ